MSILTLSSPVVGRMGREGADEPFATNLAGNGNAHTSGLSMLLSSTATSGNFSACRRGYLAWDPTASPLPAGSVITAVSLKQTPGVIPTNDFAQSWCITNATIIAPLTGAADADYQGCKNDRTEYSARVNMTGMVNGTASTWVFNATGISYISTQYGTGNPIVLGLKWSADVDQSIVWASAKTDNIAFTVGQLVITYRVGPGHAVIDVTGTLANSADTVNCNLFTIDVIT